MMLALALCALVVVWTRPALAGNPLSPIVGYEQINLTESCGSCGSHAGAICLGYFADDTSTSAVETIEHDVYSDFGLPCRPGPSDLVSAYNGYLKEKKLPWKAVQFSSSSDVLGYIEKGSPVVANVDMWGGHYVAIYGLTGSDVYFSDGTTGTGLSGSSLPTGNLKKWPWSSFLDHATGEYIGFDQTSTPPRGYLDQTDCTAVAGWTQDESAPTTAIDAEIDFNGATGSTGTTAFRLLANVSRSDLCSAIGSCDHAFSLSTPRSVMDGAAHKVYAYGLNPTAGGSNTLLTNAPKSLTCNAPAIPKGDVKRHVTNPTILADWRFDTFVDEAPYGAAELAAVADGVDFGSAPRVVQVSGQSAVYVVDGSYSRHIVNAASLAAWRLTSADVKTITAAALAALEAGPDWPALPLLAKDPSSPTVYLLDVPFAAHDAGVADSGTHAAPDARAPKSDAGVPAAADSGKPERGPGASSSANNGDDAGAGDDTSSPDAVSGAPSASSSGCAVSRSSEARSAGWLVLAAAGFVVAARRKSRAGNASR